jgi:flavin reductase (DIM6/NTAB) family NADH-FMN oxidoreductase RutF
MKTKIKRYKKYNSNIKKNEFCNELNYKKEEKGTVICIKKIMSKILWKPGTFEYPIPAVMVSCGDMEKSNIITIAWTGILCTNPAKVYIAVRPERYSYNIIKETGEFVINLTTEKLAYATDWCGVKSGRNVDKFKEMKLTKQKANFIKCPMIKESPVSIECKVVEIKEEGSHHVFIADVLGIDADEKYIDENGAFDISKCNLIAYANGGYYALGKKIGKFGFSVKKSKKTIDRSKKK